MAENQHRSKDKILSFFRRSPSPLPDPEPTANLKHDKVKQTPQISPAQADVPQASGALMPVSKKKPVVAALANDADVNATKPSQPDSDSSQPIFEIPAVAPVAVTSRPRNLSEEAFQALPTETQTEVRTLIPEAGTAQFATVVPDQIHAVMEVVKRKQDECEKKFWKIKIFGQDMVIRDYVKATLGILQQVGDVAINFAPAPGSVVWSALKTLMQVCGIGIFYLHGLDMRYFAKRSF